MAFIDDAVAHRAGDRPHPGRRDRPERGPAPHSHVDNSRAPARARHLSRRSSGCIVSRLPMPQLFDELDWRGLVYDKTEGVREALAKEQVTGYIGFDPTA